MSTVTWTAAHHRPESETSSQSGTEIDEKEKRHQISVSEIPPLGEPVDTRSLFWQKSAPIDLDAIATQRSVYDDPTLAEIYRPREDWENLHRFNPLARWTWREEKALVRKIDIRIFIFTCIAFMALEIDRVNLQQAVADNLLKDLKLTTNDYNLGNTVFTLSFMCAELPSQLVSKWMGPDRWIPLQMILWSIVASAQYKLDGRTAFLATRSLLGILQGGFIPDMNLYLSYFYTSAELPVRLSRWWASMTLAIIVGAFLAFGLLHLDGVNGVEGWRYLFLIEGIITGLVGVSAFYFMPPSPTQTAGRLRGKNGWFTEREETIIINRVLRDDPSKGTMHNRQPITPKLLFQALSDYHLWPVYVHGLLFQIPMGPPLQYLSLSLKGLGFSTFQTNLLVIPSQVLQMTTLLLVTLLAGWTQRNALNGIIAQLWVLGPLVSLYVLNTQKENKWIIWGITSVLLGYPSNHSVQVGWVSRNANTVRTRTVSTAMYNMCVQAGSVIFSNVYRKDDAPRYRRGNRDLIAICVMNIFLYVCTNFFYKWINSRRDNVWDKMTPDEREQYIRTTKDQGNKRLDFRFAR